MEVIDDDHSDVFGGWNVSYEFNISRIPSA